MTTLRSSFVLLLSLLVFAPFARAEPGTAEKLESLRKRELAWRTLMQHPSHERLRTLLEGPQSLGGTLELEPELFNEVDSLLEEQIAYEVARLESLREERLLRQRRPRPRARPKRTSGASTAPPSSVSITTPVRPLAPPPTPAPRTVSRGHPAPSKKPSAPKPTVTSVDSLQLADAYYTQGRFQEALAHYAAVTHQLKASQATLARARFGLARSLERLGRTDEALSTYRVVADQSEAEPWTSAADFAARFLGWRRRLAATEAVPTGAVQ